MAINNNYDKMKQLLVIIGMPGSGKDTQIEFMAKRRKLEVIRIGDLVRAKAVTNNKIDADLDAGNLVDNDIVNNLVKDAIQSAPDDSYLISDGFPRDIEQAKWLDEFASNNACKIVQVLVIRIEDSTAIERLKKRGREDDDEDTINHRLEVFHDQTDRVIDYYKSSQRLSEVNGEDAPEEVAQKIENILQW